MTDTKHKPVITPCGIFATPASMDDLQDYIEQFNGGERVAAQVAAGMAWNLAAELTKDLVPKEGK